MGQLPPRILPSPHVGDNVVAQQRDMEAQALFWHASSHKVDVHGTALVHHHRQHTHIVVYLWGERLSAKPAAPLAAIDDEARRIDRPAAPCGRILALADGEGLLVERIRPTQPVPVCDMKGDGYSARPQTVALAELAQPSFSGRATAAALRCVQLDQAHPLGRRHKALCIRYTCHQTRCDQHESKSSCCYR